MPYSDLPHMVKTMTASPKMRWRHRYWHWVKNPRFVNSPQSESLVAALAKIGWTAALTGEPGSGLDFLFMHRMMIHNVDEMLTHISDPDWPRIVGWTDIPPGADDPDWPEPEIENLNDPTKWPVNLRRAMEGISQARSESVVEENLNIATALRNPDVLRRADMTLDRYGYIIETTVHNWMHGRFSAAPPADLDDVSVTNDWLSAPFSSHVNPYFWKLHGWIDDCIGHWERARGETADFSSAWRPPADAPPISELDVSVGILEKAEPDAHMLTDGTFFLTPPEEFEAAKKSLGL